MTQDLWAEYERKDGMVKRATQYIDASKEEPIKIVESFDHRKWAPPPTAFFFVSHFHQGLSSQEDKVDLGR